MHPNVVGVIPARRQSRRFPGKNRASLDGYSLLSLAVSSALTSEVVTSLIATSDDPQLLDEATTLGVPFVQKRPRSLAQDATRTADVVLHAVTELRDSHGIQADVVVTLQPTSPLRQGEDVKAAYEAWAQTPSQPLTTCALPLQPVKDLVFQRKDGSAISISDLMSSSDLDNCIFLDGMIYITPYEYLVERRSLFDLDTGVLFPIDPLKAVDIDYSFQLELARKLR